MKSQGIYENGKQEGEHKCWYDNGQMNLNCVYKDGKQEGKWIL